MIDTFANPLQAMVHRWFVPMRVFWAVRVVLHENKTNERQARLEREEKMAAISLFALFDGISHRSRILTTDWHDMFQSVSTTLSQWKR